jgi:hypothetical protein
MKLLLLFLVLSLSTGIFWEHLPARRYLLPVAGLGLAVMVGYFYFNQS